MAYKNDILLCPIVSATAAKGKPNGVSPLFVLCIGTKLGQVMAGIGQHTRGGIAKRRQRGYNDSGKAVGL